MSSIAKANDVDIIVLSEIGNDTGHHVRTKLATEMGLPILFANLNGIPSKTYVYSTQPGIKLVPIRSDSMGRLNIFIIKHPLFSPVLLGTVHLVSKDKYDDHDQLMEARAVRGDFGDEVDNQAIGSYIICGDFNMNPFDDGMRSASAFHAVMDQRILEKPDRIIQGRTYEAMYSPMWSLLGDRNGDPPGSYYHSGGSHRNTYWHILDQFLLSKALLSRADILAAEILIENGAGDQIYENGSIDKSGFSDHLPILLKMRINNEQ